MKATAPLPASRPYLVHHGRAPLRRRWLPLAGTLAAIIAIVVLVLFARYWPFTRQAVTANLAQAAAASVEIASFRQTFFPHPGAVAEGVTIRRNRDANLPPLITINKLTIQASYNGLLRHHVALLRAEGMHAVVPRGESLRPAANSALLKTVIDELQADGALLEFLSPDPTKPATQFQIHQFRIHDVSSRGRMTFQVALRNPKPPGEVQATGEVGPWRADDPQQTNASGSYSFRQADLGKLAGIAGMLSSDGKFHGPISSLQVEGTTDTPDFEVASVAHREHLSTNFHAVVNATNGDVSLPTVQARLGDTAIAVRASVVHLDQQPGKTAAVEFFARQGRIQDLLWLFTRAPRPPLAGVASFRGNVTIPPGREKFLRKVVCVADFGIDDARFTTPETEQKVSQMSERARGDRTPPPDPPTVLSDLKGHVELRGGVAHFSSLSFAMPGAVAHLQGTYDVIADKLNLQGTVQTQVKISDTTTGVKSLFVKALTGLMKKDRPEAPIPVTITGTYSDPHYRIDLTRKNK